MKATKYFLLVLLFAWMTPVFAAGLAGRPLPAFSLLGRDGIKIGTEQFRGKVVYLDFWASWCGPCRKSFPWMNALQSKYGAQGLQVVAINLDESSEDGMHFLKETPAQFQVAFDPKGTTPGLFAIKGMPSSLLIGRDGKVMFEHSGFKESDISDLEKKIAFALSVAQ